MKMFSQQFFVVVKMTERRKNQSEEWTYFTLIFIYFITVNKYRFCISVIRYINIQIIGIGYKKNINIGRSLNKTSHAAVSPLSKQQLQELFTCHKKSDDFEFMVSGGNFDHLLIASVYCDD